MMEILVVMQSLQQKRAFATVLIAALCTCNYGFGYGIHMIASCLHHSILQNAKMMISHSIVAPQTPWCVENKSLMRNVPDPSSASEGAGTQTTSKSPSFRFQLQWFVWWATFRVSMQSMLTFFTVSICMRARACWACGQCIATYTHTHIQTYTNTTIFSYIYMELPSACHKESLRSKA